MTEPQPPRPLSAGGWGQHDPRWPGSESWRSAAEAAPSGWGPDPGAWQPVQAPSHHRVPAAVPGGKDRPARQWWVLPGSRVGYQGLLRGPKRRWWRPLLALLLALPIIFAGATLAMLPVAIIGVLAGEPDVTAWMDLDSLAGGAAPGPGGMLYLFLSLVALIPAAMLSVWAVHRVRPGFLSSVAGRLRWRWLLRVTAVVVPIFALYFGVVTVLGGLEGSRPEQWVVLLIIAVTLSPFQAAGEEYLFRGWILQNVGAYFARPLIGLAVGTVLSAAAFTAAHGSADPYVIATFTVMSVATCYLTWRTGGLEAAIVIHAVNNVGVGVVGLTLGGYAESFVDGETEGSPLALGLELALFAVLVAAVVWVSRRSQVARWYEPPVAVLPPPTVGGWPGLSASPGPLPGDQTRGAPPANQTWGAPPANQTWGAPPANQTWGAPPANQTWGAPPENPTQGSWDSQSWPRSR